MNRMDHRIDFRVTKAWNFMGVWKIFARSIKFEEFEVGLIILNHKARLNIRTDDCVTN